MPCVSIETGLIPSRKNWATFWAANCTTLICGDLSAEALCGICLSRTLRNPAKHGKSAGRLCTRCGLAARSRVRRHRDLGGQTGLVDIFEELPLGSIRTANPKEE